MADEIKVKLTLSGSRELKAQLRNLVDESKVAGTEMAHGFQQANKEVAQLAPKLDSLVDSFAALKSAATNLAVFAGVRAMTNELIDAQIAAQQIKFTLQAAAGSAEGANREFEYISGTAQELGVQLDTTAEAYGKFLISAKAANVPLATTRDLFRATAEAGTVFHLSSTKMHQAMLALEQMMAKGAITTQELKLQLGQALPGAYEYFMNIVKSRGVDFQSALEKGQLKVHEYSEDLAKAIRMTFKPEDVAGAAEGLNAQLNRMKNAIFMFKSDISGGVFEEMAAESAKSIADTINSTREFTKQFGPLGAALTVGGAALFAYSKAMGAVNETGGKFIQNAKARITAMVNESAMAAKAAVAAQATAVADAAAADAGMVRARVLELETQETISLLSAEAQLYRQQIVLMEAELKEGVVTQELLLKRRQLVTTEHALTAAKTELTAATARSVAAQEASVMAGNKVISTTQNMIKAEANAARGFNLMGAAMKGLNAIGKGLFNLIGGWPGLILGAVVALKEMHDWLTESAKEAEKVSEELEKASTKASIELNSDSVDQLAHRLKDAKASELELYAAMVKHQNLSAFAKDAGALTALIPGSQALVGILDYQAKKEEEILAKQREQIQANEQMLRVRREQLEILGKVQELTNSTTNATSELSNDQKEITKLKQKAERLKKKTDNPLQQARDDFDLKLAGLQEKGKAAGEAFAKAFSEGKATKEMKDEFDKAGKAYAEFLTKGKKQLAEREEALKAVEAAEKKLQSAKDWKDYMNDRIRLEKELDAAMKKRQQSAALEALDSSSLSAPDKKRIKERMEAEEQFRNDIEKVNSKHDKTGKFLLDDKERARRTLAFTNELGERFSAIDATADRENAERQTAQLKKVSEAMKDLDKIQKEFTESQKNNTLTAAEVIQKQTQLEESATRVRDAINEIDPATKATTLTEENRKRVLDELTASQLALANAMNTARKAQGSKELRNYQLGLAAQAGNRDAGDILARDQFMSQNEALARNAGMVPGSPEYNAQLEASLKYFDQIQAKAKGLTTVYEDMGAAVENFANQLVNTDWVEAARKGPEAVRDAFLQMIQSIVQEFVKTQILKMVRQLSQSIGGAGTPMPGTSGLPGFASGGAVRGPGSSTSDSIPTMLSNGEYVMNARAVQKYGLGFMESLNERTARSGAPLRYAEGGLVGAASGSAGLAPKVSIINATGEKASAESGKGPDGEAIVNVVVGRVADSVRRGGIVGRAIERSYGAARVGKK